MKWQDFWWVAHSHDGYYVVYTVKTNRIIGRRSDYDEAVKLAESLFEDMNSDIEFMLVGKR